MGGSLLDNETRPGQSSAAQAQDAGLVRILGVAREGAYDTSHEPPTADPHGGWCGGWGLETPGYPTRPRVHFLSTFSSVSRKRTSSSATGS